MKVEDLLNECLQRGLTFAAFRVPGGPPRLWVQREPELETVDGSSLGNTERIFVVAAFAEDPGTFMILRPDIEVLLGPFVERPTALTACNGFMLTDRIAPLGLDRNGYMMAVAAAKQAFATSELGKVVLARTVTRTVDSKALPELFLRAEREHPNAFVALVHTPLHGTWLGASPERLLVAEGDDVLVDALAGSMPQEQAPEQAAEWGAKERDEQEIVTRKISQQLKDLGIQSIALDGPHVRRTGRVAHLITTVTGSLGGINAGRIATGIHPTPAVCGDPMELAKTFIRTHEPPRTLYAGFWGPWGIAGRTDLYVNIRCVEVMGGNALIHVGAGITSGSDPESEWEETELKARTWLDLIKAQRRGG